MGRVRWMILSSFSMSRTSMAIGSHRPLRLQSKQEALMKPCVQELVVMFVAFMAVPMR